MAKAARPSDGTVAFCTDANCLNCRNDYAQCAGCNTANGYYLNTTSHACVLYTTLPSDQGRKTSDGTVAFCSASNCIDCINESSQCVACDTATGYYLEASPNSCLLYTSLANGKGRKTADGTVQLLHRFKLPELQERLCSL
jgi:hypothetical protein